MRDLKYLLAYLLPFSAVAALSFRGIWAWSTVVLAFGLLPLFELLLQPSVQNIPEMEEPRRSKKLFFDFLLYLNAPLLFFIVFGYFNAILDNAISIPEVLGLSLGTGIIVGVCGINVAHELGHRTNKIEQWLAQLMLIPALYQHFFVEHNRGHHKNVATDLDPATARLGEPLFGFWIRSVSGGWRHAWQLEKERLARAGKTAFSSSNAMWKYVLMQSVWLGGISVLFGWKGLIGAAVIAVVGILLLETVNYIEHYGLQRRLLPDGRTEPVLPRHSWNSDHEMGRIFLYELTRHSDHHYKATRKYQILRHIDESPQLPFGYPAGILLALVPPLWFLTMNKRVAAHQAVQAF